MRIVFVTLFSLAAARTRHTQYRTDYEYNAKTDAFYKIHVEPSRNYDAKLKCLEEGAELMIPSSQDDIVQIHKMLKQFPDIGNYVMVAEDGLTHESAEETPIYYYQDLEWSESTNIGQCDVVSREGVIETSACINKLPFICKINSVNVVYDPRCKVYSPGYKYYNSVGSCYKISHHSVSWNKAYHECRVVGAHLVIINSLAEHSLLYNITNAAPRVVTSTASWFILAGIRASESTDNSTRVFKTIFNETLEQAGFAEWTPGEPNNASDKENCGSIFLNDGNYNDVDCTQHYGYMCETDVGTTNQQ